MVKFNRLGKIGNRFIEWVYIPISISSFKKKPRNFNDRTGWCQIDFVVQILFISIIISTYNIELCVSWEDLAGCQAEIDTNIRIDIGICKLERFGEGWIKCFFIVIFENKIEQKLFIRAIYITLRPFLVITRVQKWIWEKRLQIIPSGTTNQ